MKTPRVIRVCNNLFPLKTVQPEMVVEMKIVFVS